MNGAAKSESSIDKVLIIIFACLFIYAPVFHGGWLWDDDSEVTKHMALRYVAGLGKIWTAQSSVDFLPLKSTVQWIFFRFAGENPTWWHLLNVALHIINSLLVWKLVSRLGVARGWIAGLLFAVHPLAVYSVAWISELKNTLSLPFLILAMLSYIAFDERGRWKDYLLAVVFFLAAMLTKSSGVMFPFVILLYAWWRRAASILPPEEKPSFWRLIPWRVIWSTIPFFLISLGVGLATVYFQHSRAIGPEVVPLGGPLSRIALSGVAVWFYLYKAIMPFRLLPNYPRWEVDPPSLWQLLAWPAIFALLFYFWTRRRSWGRHALLGMGFFLLNLVPILGFIRISYMRITWASDHFVYLSLVGMVGLAAAAANYFYETSEKSLQPWLRGGALALLAIFAIQSHRYSGVFFSEETMWTYTLQRNPDAWQAHSRLSSVMMGQGNFGAGFFHAKEARRLRPDLAETYNNYANALAAKGELVPAIAEQRKAVELAPYSDFFLMNLANLLARTRQVEEARKLYKILLDKNPNEPMMLCNYGASLFYEGKVDEAIPYFQKAVDISPNLEFAQANLAAALRAKNSGLPPQFSGGGSDGVQMLNSDSPIRLFQ